MDFSHFKYSSDNIPKGFGFSHFSALHFFWLFLCIAVAVGCCLLYRKLKPKGRRNMLWIMTALLLGDEIWKVAPVPGIIHTFLSSVPSLQYQYFFDSLLYGQAESNCREFPVCDLHSNHNSSTSLPDLDKASFLEFHAST